jgi:hypothetical protein
MSSSGEQLSETVRLAALVCAIVLATAATACRSDATSEFWSPFSSQSAWDVGDGRILVELSGFERGHEPGRLAEFTVEIENRRNDPAFLTVCTTLIDEARIVQQFDRFTVELGPDDRVSTTFDAAFDQDIDPRAYGLALVIGDLGAIVHTVRVGIPDDEAGPWLDVDQLVCD